MRTGLPEEMIAHIRRHKAGADNLRPRAIGCHYCKHKAVIIYGDSNGHIQTKCKKCGKESIYNLALRRNRPLFFRR